MKALGKLEDFPILYKSKIKIIKKEKYIRNMKEKILIVYKLQGERK